MISMETQNAPHSREFFGPERQFWWYPDFLELMGRRWGVSSVRSVLDVGCGLGLWTASLAFILPDEVKFIGVDSEPEWIRIASSVAQDFGLSGQRHFQFGTAEALDFPDGSFDLVTCQTLLIHLKSPEVALEEMLRVLKPGGLLILVEPNNLIQALCSSSTKAEEPILDALARVRFHMLCERGRLLLGEGNFSLGDLLPGMLHKMGLQDIKVYQSDHAHGLWGNYDSPEQAAFTQSAYAEIEPRAAACSPWSPTDAKRFFLAAGGTEEDFEEAVCCLEAEDARIRQAVRDHTYHRAGGNLMYLISGVKPPI